MNQYLKRLTFVNRRRLYSLLLAILTPLFYQKAFEIYKILQKWNIFARSHQIKKCFLFHCRHAVVIMQILNWTNHAVLAIHDSPLYYEISEEDHRRTVTHARDHWWTLDFANAFVSPGVNSRAELVPSHDVSPVGSGIKHVFAYSNDDWTVECSNFQHRGKTSAHAEDLKIANILLKTKT
jgi:hypothetical protein